MALGFATSYIPTTSAQVTRASDNASMTGTNFSSWYNQGQGTIYAEMIQNASASTSAYVCRISDGSNNNSIYFYLNNTASGTQLTTAINGGNQIDKVLNYNPKVIQGALFKTAGYFSNNNYGISNQGNVVGTSPAGNTGLIPSAVNQINIGSFSSSQNALNGWIKKFVYYPKALSSAEIQEITS